MNPRSKPFQILAFQGALRKREKSLDDVLNAAPTPTTLSKSTETAIKHSVVETVHPNGEIVKSEKVLTTKKVLKTDFMFIFDVSFSES